MRTSFCLLFCWALGGCSGILPQREQTVGSCTKETDCGDGGQVCKANQCVPCSAHGDCQSAVCDLYGDLGGAGRCVASSNIIYVNNSDPDGQDCSIGMGSQELPWCSLESALTQLTTQPGKIISLHGSPTLNQIPAVTPSLGSVVLVGSGQFSPGETTTLNASTLDGNLQVEGGGSLVIDGVLLTAPGIMASPGSKITIRRSMISNLQTGARFDGSTVTLDSNHINQNLLGLAFNSSTVNLTNSLITANTAEPSTNMIEVNGGSGVFQFNTVAYNILGSSAAHVLNCAGASTLVVKNSIFVQNRSTQQLSQGCFTIANSLVVGRLDPDAAQLRQDPVFENTAQLDLRLRAGDATNTQFLLDKAVQVNPATEKNTDHDYFGNPRPQGSGYDIGAFELASP